MLQVDTLFLELAEYTDSNHVGNLKNKKLFYKALFFHL